MPFVTINPTNPTIHEIFTIFFWEMAILKNENFFQKKRKQKKIALFPSAMFIG